MGVVDMSTSQGRNFCIRSPFGAFNISLERSIQEIQILGEQHWSMILVSPCFLKKHRLGPQNDPESLEPEKLPKWKNVFRAHGIGGWPPISTWINPPSLGRNGIHCVEFPGKRGKRLLNLNLGELLTLLEASHCLVCGRLSRTCCWRVWVYLASWSTWEDHVKKESLCFVITLSTCFCWIKGA